MRWALIVLMLWLCVLGAGSDPGDLGDLRDLVDLGDVDVFDELDETGELFEAEDSDEIDDMDETIETEEVDGLIGLDNLGGLGGLNKMRGAFNQGTGTGGCHSEKKQLMDSPRGGCHTCSLYSEMRQMSLAVIREQVLAKLGFTHAPNTTGRELPQVPKAILLQYERDSAYEREMQSDQPMRYSYHEDEDDFQAKIEKIIAMPR